MKQALITIAITVTGAFVLWVGAVINDALVWSEELQPLKDEHTKFEQEHEKSSEKLESIERILLKRDIRDVSADIRKLERARSDADDWNERDEEDLAQLEEDLDALQDELDNLTK